MTRNAGVVFIIVVVCWCANKGYALENGLGRTPQMGWNSWNHFGCNINEAVIKDTAKTIASSPLKAAGYVYVNIDDCWAKSRAANGTVVEDRNAFPSGIKSLADYVHSLGLKFGIYSDSGAETCAGRPGSLGYEKNDAMTYASWGVDYLKYDNCNSGSELPEARYPRMRDALNATGRRIFFSMCEWGVDHPASWAREVGNSWRTTDDIQDNWTSMLSNLDWTSKVAAEAGPGGWNDPDMLEVGNGGMSTVEYQSHFSLWAITKAPLIIGNDVTKMSQDVLNILTNEEVIAINQDSLGVQARRITQPLTSLNVAHVHVDACQGTPNQRWTFNSDSTIRSVLSGSCLDVPNCSTASSAPVGTFPCHIGEPNQPCDNKNQQWTVGSDETIRNNNNNFCLDVWNNAGPSVVMWNCGTKPGRNDKWTYNSTSQEIKNSMVNDAYYGGCLTLQTYSDQEIWAGPLAGGSVAVALFNRGDATADITASWKEIGLASGVSATVRDLWARQSLGTFTTSFTASVGSHATKLVKITPK